MTSPTVDLAIVGGGIVGLAVARRFLLDHPGTFVEVVEKEPAVAMHQTGRNSGVVHAGIYYAPGSEKSTLTRRGVSMLREYCAEHSIAFDECGKLVVARDDAELGRLAALRERAEAAGVPGLDRLGPDGIATIEPNVVGVEAVHSPTTAITDYGAIARAMVADIANLGGRVRCGEEVLALDDRGDRVRIDTPAGPTEARRLVICGGLQTDRLAVMAGGARGPRIVPFRGEYFELGPGAASLVRALVYPVPDPRYPFLGVHFTRRVDGRVDVGPNAVLALAREGYAWRDVDGRELARLLTWPGAWRLGARHWRTGIHEIAGSLRRSVFARRARTYVPALRTEDLRPMPAGVRAQAVDDRGTLLDDFVIERHGRVVAVRNAPSPAATASLAIAERIVSALTLD